MNYLSSSLSFLCLALGIQTTVFAQNHQHHQHCLFEHAIEAREAAYPGYTQAILQAQAEAARRGAANSSRSIIEIPLVVHVVWKEAEERLPECKVIEQVDILNEDFQRLNPDTANLRSIFHPVAGNPSVRFRLDSIIWQETDSLFYSGGFLPDPSAGDKVKRSSSGGSDGLDTERYANLWICNLGSGGILGFAYPPAGLSNWPAGANAPAPDLEGIVVDYRTVGRQGTVDIQGMSLQTQGRTASHELGHYLGLRHIWGDGLFAQLGIPNCTDDDGVADTPLSGTPSNFECDTTKNTCGAGDPGDLPDMIENYMDYASESCMNSFTQGQVQIMRGILLPGGQRDELANTPYLGPSRPENDAQPHAYQLQVDDMLCASSQSASTLHASPSVEPCQGQSEGNDIWFSFRATATEQVIEFSNLNNLAGAGTSLFFELFEGSCGDLQSLGPCQAASDIDATHSISNLSVGETYYFRVYSADASAHSFDICMRTPDGVVSTEIQAEQALRVYPNPSSGLFTLEFAQVGSAGSVRIFDALGRKIMQKQSIEDKQLLLDLSGQAAGVYYIQLEQGGKLYSQSIQLAP